MRNRIRPKRKRPTVHQIKDWFGYEPVTGLLRWRIDVRNGKGEGYVKYATGSEVVPRRYVTFREKYLAVADIIFVLMMGRWPRHGYIVDHIDGDPANRKWANLREATNRQNTINRKVHSNNTSGHPGVKWHDKRKYGKPKWWAIINHKGRRISLGLFDHKRDAIAARKAAEQKYFGQWLRGYRL